MTTEAEFQDFEKIYDHRFWSYSKTKMQQPLIAMAADDSADLAILMFNSLLVW